jgi:hypothetical protein
MVVGSGCCALAKDGRPASGAFRVRLRQPSTTNHARYLSVLLSIPVSLQSLEVVIQRVPKALITQDFLSLFLAHAMRSCDEFAHDRQAQNRQVRLVRFVPPSLLMRIDLHVCLVARPNWRH